MIAVAALSACSPLGSLGQSSDNPHRPADLDTGEGGGSEPAGDSSDPDPGGDLTLPSDGGLPLPLDECALPRPEWIHCDGFEGGDLTRWDADTQAVGESRLLVATAGPSGQSGNHALRLRVPAGRGGSGINKTFTPAEYDILYARWYVQFEPGFNLAAKNHGHGLHAGDRWSKGIAGIRPSGDDYFTMNVDYLPATATAPARHYIYTYYRGMYMDCADPNGSCWGDNFPCMISSNYCTRPEHKPTVWPPAIETGRWYCIELMVNAGTPAASQASADGVLNLWIDGVEIGAWASLWFRTTATVKLNHFWLGLFHHDDTHSVEGQLFDHVVVSPTRIGCR